MIYYFFKIVGDNEAILRDLSEVQLKHDKSGTKQYQQSPIDLLTTFCSVQGAKSEENDNCSERVSPPPPLPPLLPSFTCAFSLTPHR